MAWFREGPLRGVTLKRETGGPGVGEERDKGRTRETETRWIMSMNETGRRGENKWFYLNHGAILLLCGYRHPPITYQNISGTLVPQTPKP